MRILIIHNQYQHLGGEDIVMRQEMESLQQNHEVELYTVPNTKNLKGLFNYLIYSFNWIEAKKIKSKITEFKPDIIHIHNMHYAIGPFFINSIKKTGIPMVMTLHNFRLLCPSATLFHDGHIFMDSISEDFPWKAIQKKVLENSYIKTFLTGFTYWLHKKLGTFQKVNKFIILSNFSKTIFHRSTIGIPDSNFVVKPNTVKEIAPTEIIESDCLAYIGRLSEEKGILPLLHAWKATQYQLKIFGTGPQQEEVELIAKNSPNIQYFGFQPKQIVNNHLAGCKAVIVPSICYESMPLAVLEAYALGVPVLASNIGILTEMVVPLHTGMLFDPHHHTEIIRTLAEWNALSSEQVQQIKDNCRKEYLEKYQEGKVMKQLNHIYEEVISNAKN